MQKQKSLTFSAPLSLLANRTVLFFMLQSVTGLRLLAGPVLFYLLWENHWHASFMVMVFAGISDWLDGFLARRFKVESLFGELFDPIADKVFLACLFLYYMFQSKLLQILGAILLFRDVMILAGGFHLRQKNKQIRLKPFMISKINTFFLFVLGIFLLNLQHFKPDLYTFYMDSPLQGLFLKFNSSTKIDFLLILFLWGLTLFCFVTTFASGYFYARFFARVYRASSLL